MYQSTLRYNGERCDPTFRTLYLNRGYRSYDQTLMRFTSPDSLSPFAAGGINAYVYCAGDPINRVDPSGHMSWQTIAGLSLAAIGLAMFPFTAGQSLTVVNCLMSGLDAISGTTGIVSFALEGSQPEASAVLGWVSLAAGVMSVGAILGSKGRLIVKSALSTGYRQSEAFRNGLSSLPEDVASSTQTGREGQTVASPFRLPKEFKALRSQYEKSALKIALRRKLPALQKQRFKARRVYTLGENVKILQGKNKEQLVPVYSHELRTIAPRTQRYEELLQQAYEAWEIPKETYKFRLFPEALPAYSAEDERMGQALFETSRPPPQYTLWSGENNVDEITHM